MEVRAFGFLKGYIDFDVSPINLPEGVETGSELTFIPFGTPGPYRLFLGIKRDW